MKISNRLLSFLITLIMYVLFFLSVSNVEGDESSNSIIAAGAFVAMTWFVNFPLAWFIMYKILKAARNDK
ncbi:hypothetical protein [Peribacillus sp. SCS-155]|uniref:hypothetical protein n=1 Tax=Peribacillus sedimenti TaxID=3115297 RepID=UPI0039067032